MSAYDNNGDNGSSRYGNTYDPNMGIGDYISLAMSQNRGRTAAKIGLREGTKYGVSALGSDYYNNNRFTGYGGALKGGLIGAGGALLGGGGMEGAAKGGAIGAASGYAGSQMGNMAISQGASSIGAGALGGVGGSIVGLAGNVISGNLDGAGQSFGSGLGASVGTAVASGMGAGSWAGPIGMAVGAAVGLLMGTGNKKSALRGKFSGGGLSYKDGKWNAGKITGFESSDVPERWRGNFSKKAQQNLDYYAGLLNNHRDNFYNGKMSDKTAEQVGRYLNTKALRMPAGNRVKDWAHKNPSQFYGESVASITPTIKAIEDGEGFINDHGVYEWYDDGTEE